MYIDYRENTGHLKQLYKMCMHAMYVTWPYIINSTKTF